jgi:hypothetical protein
MRYVDGESFTPEERKRLRYGRKGITAAIADFLSKNVHRLFPRRPPVPR